jgi:putative Mn2+ efflux pump MntP
MSADACAAAIGRGASKRPGRVEAIRAGLVFGLAETITPLIGWVLGVAAAGYVAAVDHWTAFALLAVIGGKIAIEAALDSEDSADSAPSRSRNAFGLVVTALGTSIDAAAVGVTLALLNANIIVIVLSIGAATFLMSTAGMLVGRAIGARFGSVVEFIGGVAPIGLGAKILEHTGYLR